MSLLRCVDCGNLVSDKAEFCPKCGCPIQYIKKADILPQPADGKTDESNLLQSNSKKSISLVENETISGDSNNLKNSPIRNYDTGRESVIENICNNYVYVKGDDSKSIYEFLGYYKFLNCADRSLFFNMFGAEIEAYKAKGVKKEQRTLEVKENTYLDSCSSLTNSHEDELYYETESDIGPDSMVESYYEYHRDD